MALKPSKSFLLVAALLVLFAMAPITLSVVYYHFGGLASEAEQRLQRNLRFAFMKGTDIVDLGPLMDGAWVKFCAIDTGLTHDEVDKIVGFHYDRYGDIRWIGRPEYWTLLFIEAAKQLNAGDVVTVTPIRVQRREVADLDPEYRAKGVCATRDAGRLRLTRRQDADVGTSPVVVRVVEEVPAAAEPGSSPQR